MPDAGSAFAEDTIFAVASDGVRGAVTVLRVSGPDTRGAVEALAGRCPEPRRATLRALRDARGGLLDRALVLWFPAPHSYTGEDSAEFQLHGGRAVAEAVAGALLACGARPAEPGAFTRRAFLNGRMDLLEAEAVADLVEAETEAQRRQALRQLEGEPGRRYAGWAARLTALLAQQEAFIDFPDEDLPPETARAAVVELDGLRLEVRSFLDDGRRGELLRDGLVFAVTGPPNVGKSSLINALCERDVAIVSVRPGTTRDVIEASLVLGGARVTLLDTAGLRETDDPVEAEGIRRARLRAVTADLVVAVADATDPRSGEGAPAGALTVWNKADLARPPAGAFGVSAATGMGMEGLRDRLAAEAAARSQGEGAAPLTRIRHRTALQEAVLRLDAAASASWPELRGEELRLALRALGTISGAVGVEAILDSVFRQFCIGK